jgi:hypothetical protein
MASFSSTYPSQRPVFTLDAANAGRLDPRMTFTRASTANVFDGSKHLSSENLIAYSNPVTSQWTETNTAITVNSTAAPDGTNTASNVLETAATGYHEIRETFACTNAVSHTATFYAKANGRTVVRFLPRTSSGVIANVEFTLSGAGSESLISGTATRSIAAVGSGGWYKLTVTFTGNATATGEFQVNICESAGTDSYAGDATKGVYLWGAQVASTGEIVLNGTSGQIHREYAPSLVSKSNNIGRFDYSTDGQSAAKGILIEGQATNINTYAKGGVNGSGVVQWAASAGTATGNSAVGPDGTLSALHYAPDTTSAAHYIYNNVGSAPSGSTPHTISVYAKAAGETSIVIRLTSSYSAFANTIDASFTLTGDGSASVTGGTATASIEAVGSTGWYRCQVTETTASSPTLMRPYVYVRQTASYAGDGYSGVILWGWQVEANSFASSFVDTGTSGSTVTRAAESLSMPIASTGYTGGPVSVNAEFNANSVSSGTPRVFALKNGNNIVMSYITSGGSLSTFADVDGSNSVNTYIKGGLAANTDYKMAISYGTDDYQGACGGDLGTPDTACALPDLESGTLYLGSQDGSHFLNGNLKRLSLFSEAISDTNLQALTS